jgi:hypothetical protein
VNPARSRHCEEGKRKKEKGKSEAENHILITSGFSLPFAFYLLPFYFLSQETCPLMLLCSLLSASRKGVQAARRVSLPPSNE